MSVFCGDEFLVWFGAQTPPQSFKILYCHAAFPKQYWSTRVEKKTADLSSAFQGETNIKPAGYYRGPPSAKLDNIESRVVTEVYIFEVRGETSRV